MKRITSSTTIKLVAILIVSALLTGLSLFPLPVTSWPTVYTWPKFVGDPLGQYDTGAIPLSPPLTNDAASTSPTNNATFLAYVNATLPERINETNNISLLPPNAPDDNYNIYLNAPAKVEISFVYEGAGYRSSLGYFTFNPATPPTLATKPLASMLVDKIIFPNASFYNSGGTVNGLHTGDTVSLGTFTPAAGTQIGIGFMLVADGYMYGNPGGVRPSPNPNAVFYSIMGLNPETLPEMKPHMVLIRDPDSGLIALAMEDMNRNPGSGCDHDFNDVVYRIKVTPESAIVNLANIYNKRFPDADNDGVADTLDEFPTDPERASSVWYPSKTTWGILAYEDSWPSSGDYDMNDLVVLYNYRQILKADGTIKEVEVQYKLSAMGARQNNGFAVELTGVPTATAHTATLSVNGVTKTGFAATASVFNKLNNNLVFRLFNDAYAEFSLAPTADVRVNTIKGGVSKAQILYKMNVVFNTPLAKSAFTYAPPYNPFLFKGNSIADEVHLPGYAPTSSVDSAKFGTLDDNTSLAAKRYYVNKLGHPWALNLPSTWKWPAEGIDILRAYPDFKAWAESAGVQKPAWYATPGSNAAYIY